MIRDRVRIGVKEGMRRGGVEWIEEKMGTSSLGVDGVCRDFDEEGVAEGLYVSQDGVGGEKIGRKGWVGIGLGEK